MMEGLTDISTKKALTTTGGVGGDFTDMTNGNGQYLLGVQAPVIAEATDNLLSDEDASFEGGTIGSWKGAGAGGYNCNLANYSDGWHGSKCLKMTTIANDRAYAWNVVTSITSVSTQYANSCFVKGPSGRTIRIFFYDNGSGGTQNGTTVNCDGTWKFVSAAKTYGNGATRAIGVETPTGGGALAGDVFYIDATQLEQKAYPTPFALDSRTACSCSIANPLTAGQDLTIMCVVNTTWVGDDGILHYIINSKGSGAIGANRLSIFKHTDNNLYFDSTNNAGQYVRKYMAVNGANMPANTPAILILTRENLGGTAVVNGYLNAVAATSSGSSGTGIEADTTTLYVGQDSDGTDKLNGSILCAIFNRVLSDNEISLASKMQFWHQRLRGC